MHIIYVHIYAGAVGVGSCAVCACLLCYYELVVRLKRERETDSDCCHHREIYRWIPCPLRSFLDVLARARLCFVWRLALDCGGLTQHNIGGWCHTSPLRPW